MVSPTGMDNESSPSQEPAPQVFADANLKALLQNARNFVVYQVRLDPEKPYGGEVVLVSPSICDITGIERPMDYPSWFERIHPDDREEVIQANQAAIAQGKPFDQIVRVYHPEKDRWVWLHTVSNPVYGEDGQVTHYNGLIVDVSEQKMAEQALQRQLATEYLLTNISATFVNLEAEEVDHEIEQALRLLGEFARVDRCFLTRFSPDGNWLSNTHEWRRTEDRSPQEELQDIPVSRLPWTVGQIRKQSVIHIPRLERLPAAASVDLEEYRRREIKSMMLAPLVMKGRIYGFIGFETFHQQQEWAEDQATLLQLIGEIFASALERKAAQEALKESQQQLEEHSQARAREVTTLLDLSFNLAFTINLEPKLDLILDQLKLVVDYTGASIMRLEGDILSVVAYRGPIPHEEAVKIHFPLASAHSNRLVIESRVPLIIQDVLAEEPAALRFRQTAGDRLNTTFSYVRSWMGVPLIAGGEVVGMLSLDHPEPAYYHITPHSKLALAFAHQVAAAMENARLYAEVERRADEAQALFSVQQAITSRLDRDTVLQMIADEARRLTNTLQGAVYLVNGDDLEVAVVSGKADKSLVGYRLSKDASVAGMALKNKRSYLITDAQENPHVHADIVRLTGVQSFVIVPLMAKSGPIGTITVADKQDGMLAQEDERVLTMLASGAVIALENARYYEEEQERRREAERGRVVAESMREILRVLNSNRPFQEVLDYIASLACRLLNASSTIIRQDDQKRQLGYILASHDLPPAFEAIQEIQLEYTEGDRKLLARQPVVAPDLRQAYATVLEENQGDQENPRTELRLAVEYFRSALTVPLFIQGEAFGSLTFFFAGLRDFSDEDIRLGMLVGDQASLAIENDRLRAQVEEKAVVTERNRLARDLHDAVTQTLFSASLIAEVLPRLWDRNPEEARRRLEELRQLTRGALAEMRSLLLELRPSALIEAETSELFRHLADAFAGRARVPVKYSIVGDSPLPADVKVALYRIAQEALNNIAKHAEATRVDLVIHCTPEEISLRITDDGRGFDPGKVSAEHLGLGIMKERAEHIGAALTLETQSQQGTSILVTWKTQEQE